MRVNRIDHINITTPLLAETVAFYERLLDLRPGRAAGMDQVRNAWLYDLEDRPIVHVNWIEGDAQPLASHETGRLHHVALDCQGSDQVRAKLAAMGLPYRTNFVAEINLTQIFVLDPNGIRLELNFREAA